MTCCIGVYILEGQLSRAKSFLLMVIYVCIALHCINFTICSLNDYGYMVRIVQSDSCMGYKRPTACTHSRKLRYVWYSLAVQKEDSTRWDCLQ